MNVNKKNNLKSPRAKVYLPKFLKWLKKHIESENKNLSDEFQKHLIFQPSSMSSEIFFIFPEVFERYQNYSGVSARPIQRELRRRLRITFPYTIERKGEIVEVFPCQF